MKLFLSLLITIGVGAIAGIATATSISSWYVTLNKPSFNPPNWLFGPVWTFLYILMGISLSIIWKQQPSPERTQAMSIFFVQLFLNFCWSFIFFKFHHIGFALTDICLLWIFIIITIFSFSHFSKTASWLLVSYICWVSFALILNASIWQLNK